MTQLQKVTMLGVILGFVVGCGGGSGEAPRVSGEYRGTLRVVSDSCSDSVLPGDDTIGVFHIVNQDGEKIVLDDADGFAFTGALKGNGFIVTAERIDVVIEGEKNCTAVAQIEYTDITASGAKATTLGTVSCSGSAYCATSWSGQLERGEAIR